MIVNVTLADNEQPIGSIPPLTCQVSRSMFIAKLKTDTRKHSLHKLLVFVKTACEGG